MAGSSPGLEKDGHEVKVRSDGQLVCQTAL